METVVLVLTDVEGSTQLWSAEPAAMDAAMRRHHELVHAAVAEHGGWRPVDQGEGDSVFGAFRSATAAVAAAARIQRDLAAQDWGLSRPLTVRIGMHVGEVVERDGNLYGDPVNRCARLRALAAGGQTLMTAALHELVRDRLPHGLSVIDLGEHRMKDLARSERIFQLCGPGLDGPFPPIVGLDAVRHNLPIQTSSFIGRDSELAELVAMIQEHRLVTLTGFGGMGKTRLALQAAAELADGRLGEVWFVDLSAITDPELVPGRVAETMRLRWGAGDPTTAIVEAAHDRPCLLVLDNLEQVLGCAEFVGELLAAVDTVRVVATSREPLRVRGERQIPVPPMRLPEPGSDSSTLSTYEAVRLFVDRALAVRSDFVVDNATAPAVAAICARLDGHPLALELAASRLKVLSVDNVLQRLDAALTLLTGGARDMPQRHRTLRATIAWSYDALSLEEQDLLSRLSVFQASVDLEAVEAICGRGEHTLDLLESLVEKSLVRATEVDGEVRFDLLRSIRDFAAEQLNDAERLALAGAHARHFLQRLGSPEDRSSERSQRVVILLERELEHYRAALSHCVAAGDQELEIQITVALGDAMVHLGHIGESIAQNQRVLQLTDDVRARTAALLTMSMAYAYTAPWSPERSAAFREALSGARQLGQVELQAEALSHAFALCRSVQEVEEREAEMRAVLADAPPGVAEQYAHEADNLVAASLRYAEPERAERAARSMMSGQERDVGAVRLAAVLIDRGDAAGALEVLAPLEHAASAFGGRTTWRHIGDAVIAAAHCLAGDLDRARPFAQAAFSGQLASGIRPELSAAALAWVERASGKPGAALEVLDTALAESYGQLEPPQVGLLIRRAVVQCDLERPAEAAALLDRARRMIPMDEMRTLLERLNLLAVRARLVAAERPEEAAALLGCVDAHRGRWVLPFGIEADAAALRARLEPAYPQDWARGRELDPATAW